MAAGGGGSSIGSLQLNHNLNYLFTSVDQASLFLSQFSHNQSPSSSSSSNFIMQRGPRYEAYAALRESKLRMKQSSIQEDYEQEQEQFDYNFKLNSHKKHFIKSPPCNWNSNSNSITQQQQQQQRRAKGPSPVSVPDFTSPIKREIRRSAAPPPAPLVMDQKPTFKSKSGSYDGIMGGRKSMEKKSNGGGEGFMARKSYASLEVLKGLGSQARRAINGGGGENNAMRSFPKRNYNLDRSEFGYSTHF